MENKEIYQFYVEEDGERLDRFLGNSLENISRSYVQKLIEEGMVSLNNEKALEKKKKLKKGDFVEIEIPESKELKVEAENIPIEIVYEDDQVLVVNKPKGMVVHPAIGNYTGTLVNAIMYHCGDRLSSINGVIRPGIVHRIDKDTSGLLMIAKTNQAHESLSAQLAEHSITRRYVALVYNNIKEDEGVIDAPIGRSEVNRLKYAVTDRNSKRAVTHYKVLQRFGKYTFIECRLETGRTHQIRVHMSYKKHPLVGDSLYGPEKNPFKVEGQMLHAKVLGFVHPVTGEYMEFERDIPEYFRKVLNKLEGEN